MKIENENSFLAAMCDGLNLFLGAGFSLFAKDNQGCQLPTGSQLREELVEHFKLPDTLDLVQAATVLNSIARREFRTYLLTRFSVKDFDAAYYALEKLRVSAIFTTNIDDLLYKIYSKSKRWYLNDIDLHGASFQDRQAIDLVTLHGSVLDDSRDFIFEATELASAFARDPDRWYFLNHSLRSQPTLFWGYSLADAGTLQSLSPSTVSRRDFADTWITVRPGTDEGTLSYFKALGFQIIETDTLELLSYFDSHQQATDVRVRIDTPTGDLFPEWAIPDLENVPVRSILDFYRGAPPTWYDIFSGKLHVTRHHARIRDALNAKKDTLFVGVPGSGKSTLLMQVMRDFAFPGHKLICEAPTEERAALILNRLNGAKALIGIDNFADSVDGVSPLLTATNVQVLACDRDYYFEIVSHKIRGLKNVQVLDVTDLDAKDLQELLQRIPAEVRDPRPQFSMTQDAITPSIFEVMESHILLPALSQRYKAVLKQLAREDERLLQFLLLCSYVHSCRTPISMDMLLAYFGSSISHYSEIFEIRNNLGKLVTDYLGDLDDGVQDYYTPRSTLVAEAVIHQAEATHLRSVIARFHENVSPYRIHRFDVFRRRAYDAGLMKRVFDDWEEGATFYRKAYDRDRSPYVLQQGALFLTRKRRFQEAFGMIDEALVVTHQRIPSIRNSHAVILFRANICQPETDGTVKRTLEESMEILSECYRYDQRKAYHAAVFADQALRYDERFGREQSKHYLQTASEWLTEEHRRSPWHREVKRLCGVVKRRRSE
ncbi:SIR2 family protein [Thermodesulfobacteriota bacterium]